jgi:hypothetical protein
MRVRTECHECGGSTFTVWKEYSIHDTAQERPRAEILVCVKCDEEYRAPMRAFSGKRSKKK